jgi:hypothetical protein
MIIVMCRNGSFNRTQGGRLRQQMAMGVKEWVPRLYGDTPSTLKERVRLLPVSGMSPIMYRFNIRKAFVYDVGVATETHDAHTIILPNVCPPNAFAC